MTQIDPTAAAQTAVQTLSDDLIAKIQDAAKSLPAAFQGLATAYAPAVVRMIRANGEADVVALYKSLSGLTSPAALDTIHSHMTRQELEAEATQTTPLFQGMAEKSYEARQLAQQILSAALSASIGVALKAVTF